MYSATTIGIKVVMPILLHFAPYLNCQYSYLVCTGRLWCDL